MMMRIEPMRKWAAGTALWLGLAQPCALMAADNLAGHGHGDRAPYRYQYCPPGTLPPSYAPQPMPQQRQPQQGDQPSTDTQQRTDSNQQQTDSQQQQQQQQAQQQQQQADSSPNFSDPSASSSSLASLSPGANTPMLGRNDQSNRLNLFDNMSAAPQTRVWFGLQYAETFSTALRSTDGLNDFISIASSGGYGIGFGGGFLGSGSLGGGGSSSSSLSPTDALLSFNEGVTTEFFQSNQTIYRVGAEWALSMDFSVALQGQYLHNGGDGEASDDWTNPQVMLKYVLAADHDTIVTGTLGITPDVGSTRGTINENVTKFYPGMLFYEGITQNCFSQGGFQFGIPTDHNAVSTLDWSIALGWWAYRSPELEPGAPRRFGRRSPITGFVPQVNLLGKHVLGDQFVTGPFGFQSSSSTIIIDSSGTTAAFVDPISGESLGTEGFIIYDEPDVVIDVTLGSTIMIGRSMQLGMGVSFPITDDSVRKREFLSTLSYSF